MKQDKTFKKIIEQSVLERMNSSEEYFTEVLTEIKPSRAMRNFTKVTPTKLRNPKYRYDD